MGSIKLEQEKERLVIIIESINERSVPMAFIINYSGEVLERHELAPGTNIISHKGCATNNYSIRIVNDKNVITQKI